MQSPFEQTATWKGQGSANGGGQVLQWAAEKAWRLLTAVSADVAGTTKPHVDTQALSSYTSAQSVSFSQPWVPYFSMSCVRSDLYCSWPAMQAAGTGPGWHEAQHDPWRVSRCMPAGQVWGGAQSTRLQSTLRQITQQETARSMTGKNPG